MTSPEFDTSFNSEYPFLHDKIPVVDGLDGFKGFIDRYPNFTFCPYVAEKDAESWDRSTSRVYMNQVLPNFLYMPVNIPKGDLNALRGFFDFVQDRTDVPAINVTQPHKSSPVLRELYLGDSNSDANVDTLIRNEMGRLEPYDLNSTAFVEWYKADVGPFQDKPVVLVGIGGVGEPIAKKIAVEHPRSLLLVDVTDKSDFAHHLAEATQVNVTFEPSLQRSFDQGLPEDAVLINAAGKEGATNESELWSVVDEGAIGGVFVDIRPHLNIEIVEKAKQRGWNAHTGHGMNARNDYVLLQGIAVQIPDTTPLPFEKFQQLVARAS